MLFLLLVQERLLTQDLCKQRIAGHAIQSFDGRVAHEQRSHGVETAEILVQERRGGRHKPTRSFGIQAKISRETEVGKRIPIIRPAPSGGALWILLKTIANFFRIPEHRGSEDIRGLNLWMPSADALSCLQ